MIVKIIGSGSSGNGYALISGEDILLLECGVPAKEIYDVEITFRNGDFVIIEDERDKAVEEWNRRAEDGKTD